MTSKVVSMPRYPECWKSCGDCARGDVFILEMLVRKGDWLEKDDNVLTLETGKVALDIPTPYAGFVEEVYVEVGQKVDQQQPLIRINDQLPP